MGINQRVIKVSKIHWEGHNKLQMLGQHSYMNIFHLSMSSNQNRTQFEEVCFKKK